MYKIEPSIFLQNPFTYPILFSILDRRRQNHGFGKEKLMPVLFIVVWIIVVIVHGIFWGSMAQSAADRKGLGPNWFLCGFFLGPIGYLVAKVQDDRFPKTYTSPEVKARVRYKPSYEQQRNNPQAAIQNNFWTCSCGRVNASYITTCGKMREEIPLPEKEEKKRKQMKGRN